MNLHGATGRACAGLFSVAQVLEETYAHVLRTGSSSQLAAEGKLMSFQKFTDVVGLPQRIATDLQYRAARD